MTNPATELHELLVQWQPAPNHSIAQGRGGKREMWKEVGTSFACGAPSDPPVDDAGRGEVSNRESSHDVVRLRAAVVRTRGAFWTFVGAMNASRSCSRTLHSPLIFTAGICFAAQRRAKFSGSSRRMAAHSAAVRRGEITPHVHCLARR